MFLNTIISYKAELSLLLILTPSTLNKGLYIGFWPIPGFRSVLNTLYFILDELADKFYGIIFHDFTSSDFFSIRKSMCMFSVTCIDAYISKVAKITERGMS